MMYMMIAHVMSQNALNCMLHGIGRNFAAELCGTTGKMNIAFPTGYD